jgi:3',5'-cyclic AMP phosphodiesterase CpdA
MSWLPRGFLKVSLALVSILCLLIGVFMGFIYSPFFRYPSDGEYPEPHIREMVWPTIACPAMVVPGGEVTVELDLRTEGGTGPQPSGVAGWRAWLAAARQELEGLSIALEPEWSGTGPSNRWPSGSREGRRDELWHVRFRVPEEITPELYDLRVEVEVGGEAILDEQPHAVAVTADDDNDFTFITLADIHVHERNDYTLLSKQSNKGISEDGEPLFFDMAIEQVNLIRPDFVLMLGDYVRGQRRPGDLAREYAKFYTRLLDLEVPTYLVPGNHDKYINEIDGARFFEENLGPLYYSFEVGDCHFTCIDTYQWPADDRVVMNKLLYMTPNKRQGQVLDAGDEWDPSTYSGELSWIEKDLAAHDRSSLRVMAMHHDPYTDDGKGTSYVTGSLFGIDLPGGGGKGRHALMEIASRHDVDMVLGGHLHKDRVGYVHWESGGGETVYSCQTCVYFDDGGIDRNYPGYRLIQVEDAEITGFSYWNEVSSYPFYDGSNPGGETDLDLLERPALSAESTQVLNEGQWLFRFEVNNYLGARIPVSGLAAPAPQRPDENYRVEGGEIYRAVPIPSRPGWTMLYLKTTLDEGIPGEAANLPGQPYTAVITIR